MIVSRVLPSLIKLNCMIKLNSIVKIQLVNPAKLSATNLYPGTLKVITIRAMSTDIEKEINNPRRHFDYQQLIAKKDNENVVIIDVREHSEINETGKIPGSIHIPLAELEKALGEMTQEEFKKQYGAIKPEKNKEVIFSCKAGGRSLKALKLGLELGYSNAGNYKGGWLDWAKKTGLSK